jgi:hypothetical protein
MFSLRIAMDDLLDVSESAACAIDHSSAAERSLRSSATYPVCRKA